MPDTKDKEAIRKAREILDLVETLPDGIWWGFEVNCSGLLLIANTQEEAREYRRSLPAGLKWEKNHDKDAIYWTWKTEHRGVSIRITGCTEAPPTCKAITETKMVKVQVPTAFEEREEEQTVIVGWDCGGGEKEDA